MGLSRRAVLRAAAGGGAATLIVGAGIRPAWAADEYDALRARWVGFLVGTGYDPAVEPYASRLAQVGSAARGFRTSMAPGPAGLWPDLPIGTASTNITASFTRLRTMAGAYAMPATGSTGDTGLASAVGTGLDHLVTTAYTASGAPYDNWWDWEIGTPQALLNVVALVYDRLTAASIAGSLAAVDHHVPDSKVASYSGTSTGANRVDICRVLAVRGVLGKSSAKLVTARNALSPVFPYVRSGDGFYVDGSFIQHTWIPYTGSYGEALLAGLANLFGLLAGSTWAVTDPNRQLAFDAVERAFAPFLFNGLMMDGQRGRAIARPQDDHVHGHNIIVSILQFAEGASAAERARWRGLVKGWLQRDYWKPFPSDTSLSVPALARGAAVLADASVPATPEPVAHKVFGSMDRAVHRRPGWAFAVSMCSARTAFYETGNGENLRGWHTNSGMTYWWGDTYGNGQYSDSFWPTVDPYRLPGTTVSRKALADAAGGPWGAARPAATWVGGATDGEFAALGQDTRGLQSTLRARKAWFCLSDSVVCLGAAIAATDATTIESTVDNRNLGSGAQAFTVDGVTQPATMGWSATLTNAGWAHLAGFGGYVFPGRATIKAVREQRTGTWRTINTGGATTAITRPYLTMWFDHGADPTAAAYAYLLLPGATASATATRAATPQVSILANSATVQAITDSATGITAANFYAAGTAGPITVSAPCSVLVRESGGTLRVAVADPTRAAATITVTITGAAPSSQSIEHSTGYTTATGDPQISVLALNPITLLAEVGGTRGGSRTITFGTGTAATPGQHTTLAPTGDTYVQDGASAGTNFGADPLLVVKNAGTGFHRRSFLKFALAGLPAAPRRAILWVYGEVSDGSGTQAVVHARAVFDDTWTETGLTWNNQPALGAIQSAAPLGDTSDWIPLDVTPHVRTQYTGDRVAGLALLQETAGLFVALHSRKNAANPPFLQVIS
ncbi:MAG TPA: polysaccharide lyase family 8 super-sandwich domain-containing protein [Actinophytocola sp.]|uniref:polysaccharide lyase family 8 super-sandwich domain-containing protein n=1 Tax=Actinophytocola sp. TaxID=1872138 RepID=UPI002E09C8BB|nr:polysaccharide lyase family 8 super-sandwich domain-containing protein [Actinophytocola sp.]